MDENKFIDYYQVLGLNPEWEIDKIRKELLKKFAEAKGKVIGAVGEKYKAISNLLKLITEARKILTDPDAKAKYDQELAQWKLTATQEERAAAAAIPTIEEIWRLIDEGRYKEAVVAGKKLVDFTPNDDQAWEVYGYANYRLPDIATAIDAAEQAIRCNSKRADLYADAAQYYSDDHQWKKAVSLLNQAISLEPNNSGYKLTLSNVYIENKMWGDAEGVIQGVLSQEPANETARQFMAIVIASQAEERFPEIDHLLEENKKREARKILKLVQKEFEKAQKLAENDPDLRDLLNSESILVRRVLGINFYRRALGLIIDLVLISPATLLMSIDNGNNAIAIFFGALIWLAIWGYSWIWLAYKNRGQDLTKRLLGIQIVTDDNEIPSLGKLIARAMFKPIAIALGGLFPGLVFVFSMLSLVSENDSSAAGLIGVMIGFIIGLSIMFFRLAFDLFFVTSKEYLPNVFGFLLFCHEHFTKTTVIHSTKDDCMNFSEYHWC
ncbi:tetratricopeptide repeat protein [Nodularia chucula]|uniref:tetratricopeptide repeat protein n=1 Tax=Nodularia chucula TaxID=3093667 RepID=UPI0039C66A9E